MGRYGQPCEAGHNCGKTAIVGIGGPEGARWVCMDAYNEYLHQTLDIVRREMERRD